MIQPFDLDLKSLLLASANDDGIGIGNSSKLGMGSGNSASSLNGTGHSSDSRQTNLTDSPERETLDPVAEFDRQSPSESNGLLQNGVCQTIKPTPSHLPLIPSGDSNGSRNSQDEQKPLQVLPAIDPPSPFVVEENGFLPVLRNFNFLALWSGQVFSQLADKVYLVLMIAIIATQFQAEDQTISGWVSSIMIAFTIPAVLFGSIAGVFVDRWSKKLVLVVTNLLRGILVLGIPPALWISKGWSPLLGLPLGFCLLLWVTFLVSTLTQFFAPAEQAVIPLMVPRKHLLSANSLYTTTMMASVIIGFAVGEPLLAIVDRVMNLFGTVPDIGKEILVGGGYVLAGLLLLLIRPHEKIDPVQLESIHIWQDLREGLHYLRHHRRVRNALIQLVILFSIFAALAVLAVRLAEVIPGLKASQFGFLLAAGGVGMACGATVLGYFGKRLGSHIQLGIYGSLGIAASLVGLAFFSLHLWLVLLLLFLIGGFAALVGIPMQTTIQAETPEEMRGKVFGLQNNAVNIALTLPLALAGVAETFLGFQTVFLSLAVIAVAGGLLTWYIAPTGLQTPKTLE